MRKLLIGLVCLIVLAGGAYYGATLWAQRRAESEVDAVFAAARAKGNKASHGTVHFDLVHRTLTLADVVTEAADDPETQLRIGHVRIEGVGQGNQGRVSARHIELTDVTVGGKLALLPDLRATARAPHLEIVDYSGPAALLDESGSGTPGGFVRPLMATLAATSIGSLTIPELSLSITGGTTAAQPALRAAEYHYSGLSLQGVSEGKIRSAHVDRIALAGDTGAQKVGNFATEGANITIADLDMKPLLTLLDPASAAQGDDYRRVFARASAGPYSINVGTVRVQFDSLEENELAIKPSKFKLAEILPKLQAMPLPATPPTPQQAAQMRDLYEQMASLYEGMRIGRTEVRGITVTSPPKDTVKVAALRMAGIENGRIAEFAIEGLDAVTPQEQPVKIERFALQGIGVAELMRTSARLEGLNRKPEGADFVPLLRLLEGAELKGLTAPYQNTGKMVQIDTANISWGSFVGPLPSRARVTLRITGPIGAADGKPFKDLADAGFTNATLAFDLGLEWIEASRTFVISPAMIQVTNVGSAEAKGTLANVPRALFSTDPTAIMLAGILVEIGPVELTLHDLGGVDIAVAQMARERKTTPQAARQALVESLTQPVAALAASNDGFAALADAIARFIETPSSTLRVTVSPKGRVTLMQVAAELKEGLATALADFSVEASVNH